MVEFGHEVVKFGQKVTFWLKKQPFAQNMNTSTKKLLFLDKIWPKLVEFGQRSQIRPKSTFEFEL
jgi:hypothetical protein